MSSKISTVDSSAIGISALCLVHCLALPVIGAVLPVAGVWAEAEWIHQALVLLALPITIYAVTRHRASTVRLSFIVPAIVGLGLLFAAGFVEQLHDYETWLTTIGALLLGSAHLWRWMNRNEQPG